MRFLFALFFFISFHNIAASQQNTLMCGGKYIGYDEKFIYLNWKQDKKEFQNKLFIKDKKDGYLQVSLATSDILMLYPKKKYLSYWLYGKERIVYLCKNINL